MKYNTISTSSFNSEGKKSYKIYTDTDCAREKVATTEAEMVTIRDELEMVQKALKIQTRRCRQLVAEYTKRLQLKEQQYEAEKRLRDDQLSKVLRALLMFEARLRQEQKLISHQLEEKDYAIKKQQSYIQKLLSNHYCKNCNQYYSPNVNFESLNSSLEYVITDHPDYQSSTFESLDSSSETYASLSEKDCVSQSTFANSISSEENVKPIEDVPKSTFIRNKNKDSLGRRAKKIGHRKSIGNYFEVLKMRNSNYSPSSNDDTTSMDYENIHSPNGEQASTNENMTQTNKSESTTEDYSSLGSIDISVTKEKLIDCEDGQTYEEDGNKIKLKITDTIPVFDADGETNDNWYASASEQEDEEHRGVYRNNPVLECMNQILMQNINDPTVTPPKTPNVEKKFSKNGKKVKFSDEEDNKSVQNENNKTNELESNYYETPVQRAPNVYETPQSIYSNDYEQILSQCSETFQNNIEDNMLRPKNNMSPKRQNRLSNDGSISELNGSHYYIAMDTKSEQDEGENKIIRKSKILRTPPALPPKPANLMSKYKIQNLHYGFAKEKSSEKSLDSEPDYCSISEINLPTIKNGHKSTVVAEINLANVEPIIKKSIKVSSGEENMSQASKIINDVLLSPQYKPLSLSETLFNFKVNKTVEKAHSPVKNDSPLNKKAPSPEIPKLPQVTEIIIPEENETKSDECVNHDNYVKNNTQILQQKGNRTNRTRSIQIGSSVSSLIASFNNKQILSEIHQTPNDRYKRNGILFSSFENLQNLETHLPLEQKHTNSFESFDLSQNFEEFKLDDCEIDDYADTINEREIKKPEVSNNKLNGKVLSGSINYKSPTRVELVRATNDVINTPTLNINALQQFKKKMELEKNRLCLNNQIQADSVPLKYSEPTYEHFLECTGLSSKSILTPSRIISNHKSVLKPKDVKLRSKIKANALEKDEVAVKYWSEPFL
ncbi:hypothetical protein RN001_005344 [Aquatica leii]|uniref:Uncharacterized protein n=1 Tax=Aquatica leii TaxID=1421715 RepID=A0AAN7P6G1_9COLE|nr:hypothetical protein RN001_005344 [Aquatica leii]